MKQYLLIIPLFLLLPLTTYSQNTNDLHQSCLESREKANYVLAQIGYNQDNHLIILYSLYDEYYYIITHTDDSYQEYYVYYDSINNILTDKEVTRNCDTRHITKRTRKIYTKEKRIIDDVLRDIKNGKQIIYHSDSIVFASGVRSYLLIKIGDNIVDEYFGSSLVSPVPCKFKLWLLLNKKVIEVSTPVEL